MRVERDVRFSTVPHNLIRSGVSDRGVRLWALLDCHAGPDGAGRISRKQLAAELRCSDRTVDAALDDLIVDGWVDIESGASTGTQNVYRLRSITREGTKPVSQVVAEVSQEGAKPSVVRPYVQTLETEDVSGVAVHLSNLLADLIEQNGSKRPTVTKRWITEADRMLRIDGRTPTEAETLIRWSQSEPFWKANVLSMPKFRDQYDRLRLQAARKPRGGNVIDIDAVARRVEGGSR